MATTCLGDNMCFRDHIAKPWIVDLSLRLKVRAKILHALAFDCIVAEKYLCKLHQKQENKIFAERAKPFKKKGGGFPGGAVVENLPANAGDTGSRPGLGGSHMPRSD